MGRFLVDQMCGSLARYLRFCGHDAVYALDLDLTGDDELAVAAAADDRRLVTRDRRLAARQADAILVTALDIEGQLADVAGHGVAIELPDEPRRCGRCNGVLDRRDPAAADPEYVPDDLDIPTYACRRCGQVFWRGSHWDRVGRTIERARTADED